jgi:hypothetical protein
MLRPHLALLWSAKSNWFRSYKHVAALRPKPLSNNTQLPPYAFDSSFGAEPE